MTNLRTILFTAIVLLMFILLIVSTHTSIEPFASKKCSNIPFKKVIKDSKSQAEYEEWKKNDWDKLTLPQKDTNIEQWDKMPCAEQNQWYKFLVDRRKKREAIDNNV